MEGLPAFPKMKWIFEFGKLFDCETRHAINRPTPELPGCMPLIIITGNVPQNSNELDPVTSISLSFSTCYLSEIRSI